MNNFNELLQKVTAQAKAIGLPVSDHIVPNVKVNTRAKKRFGQCMYRNGIYTIELSVVLLNAPEKSCCQTLAHELIHTCPGCSNHGVCFHQYAAAMNAAYGYHIKTTNSCEEMGVKSPINNKDVKYILQCRQCGALIKRMRCSAVVADPSKYRCQCGGGLIRIK